MKVVKIGDYTESNGSWSIEDCLDRVRELAKEKPERTQMIILLKDERPGEWMFTRLVVNMRVSEQLALLESAKHDVLHELTGDELPEDE